MPAPRQTALLQSPPRSHHWLTPRVHRKRIASSPRAESCLSISGSARSQSCPDSNSRWARQSRFPSIVPAPVLPASAVRSPAPTRARNPPRAHTGRCVARCSSGSARRSSPARLRYSSPRRPPPPPRPSCLLLSENPCAYNEQPQFTHFSSLHQSWSPRSPEFGSSICHKSLQNKEVDLLNTCLSN